MNHDFGRSWRRWLRFAAVGGGIALVVASGCSGGSPAHPQRVVYEANDGTATNIFTIDPDSGNTTQITDGESFDGNPGWSPDHKRVVFVSNRGHAQQNDVYAVDADGGNAHPLAETPDASEWSPKFSPDGKRIAFALRAGDGRYSIAMMNADGSGQKELAGPYKFAEFPAWTRDGKQVYYAAIEQDRNDSDIYSVDVNTLDVAVRIATPAADLCPHFSHDGEYVTYATSAVGDEENVDLYRHELSSDDTTGASDERLTESSGSDEYGNPSPDDKRYVFVSKRDGNFELYVMDADGANQRRLTTTPDARENVPDW